MQMYPMNQNNLFVPIQMKLFMLKSDFDFTSENGIVMHNVLDRHIKRFQKVSTVIGLTFVIIQIILQMFLCISMKTAILQETFHLPLLIKLKPNGQSY